MTWNGLRQHIKQIKRHVMSSSLVLLNVLAEAIPRDPTGTVAISTIASELCMIAAARR